MRQFTFDKRLYVPFGEVPFFKNAVPWDVTSCGSSKNGCFGGLFSAIIRVERNGELATLAVNNNWRMPSSGI
jgi:hypothetical protein